MPRFKRLLGIVKKAEEPPRPDHESQTNTQNQAELLEHHQQSSISGSNGSDKAGITSAETPLNELNAGAATRIYSPLIDNGQIRLVFLHPAVEMTDPIKCTVTPTALHGCPPLEALSYVWGSVDNPGSIHLNNEQFQVTQNLHLALSYLRSMTEIRVLWIDALAINQCDVLERNAQVLLMPEIYSVAEQTIAWLGRDIKFEGISLFQFMSKPDVEKGLMNPQPSLELSNPKIKWEMALAMTAMGLFNPYWSRTWVFQEIAFAKKVFFQSGSYSVPYEVFRDLWIFLKSFVENVDNADEVRRLEIIMGLRTLPFKILKPGMMLSGSYIDYETYVAILCPRRNCRDPRDKVYGVLGCLPPAVRHYIKVDYQLPVYEVYGCITRAFMKTAKSVACLELAGIVSEGSLINSRLPSWVRDYSTTGGENIPILSLKWPSHLDATFDFSHQGQILNVRGLSLGSVAKKCATVGPYLTGWEIDAVKLFDSIKLYFELGRQELGIAPKQLDYYTYTLCGGYISFERITKIRLLLDAHSTWSDDERERETQSLFTAEVDQTPLLYLLAMTHSRRSFFKVNINPSILGTLELVDSSSDRLGFGPAELLPGDELYCIHGVSSPLALRRVGPCYKIIGAVFLAEFKMNESFRDTFINTDPQTLTRIALC